MENDNGMEEGGETVRAEWQIDTNDKYQSQRAIVLPIRKLTDTAVNEEKYRMIF